MVTLTVLTYQINLMNLQKLVLCVSWIALGSHSIQSAKAQAPAGPAACANSVYGISQQQKVDVCRNGGTLETAKCVTSVYGLDTQQKIDLCKNGGTSETAKCATSVYGISQQQKVDVCRNGGTLETAKCVTSVYGLDTQQKIDLCKNGGTSETAKICYQCKRIYCAAKGRSMQQVEELRL